MERQQYKNSKLNPIYHLQYVHNDKIIGDFYSKRFPENSFEVGFEKISRSAVYKHESFLKRILETSKDDSTEKSSFQIWLQQELIKNISPTHELEEKFDAWSSLMTKIEKSLKKNKTEKKMLEGFAKTSVDHEDDCQDAIKHVIDLKNKLEICRRFQLRCKRKLLTIKSEIEKNKTEGMKQDQDEMEENGKEEMEQDQEKIKNYQSACKSFDNLKNISNLSDCLLKLRLLQENEKTNIEESEKLTEIVEIICEQEKQHLQAYTRQQVFQCVICALEVIEVMQDIPDHSPSNKTMAIKLLSFLLMILPKYKKF